MDYLIAIGIYCAASPVAIVLLALALAWNRDRVAHRRDTALTRELATTTAQADGTAA